MNFIFFQVHALFEFLSFLCNLVNMILIYVSRSGSAFDTPSSMYHAILGPLSFVSSIINFVIGIVIHIIKKKNKPYPFFLKCLHYVFGHFAYFAGGIELVRGAYVQKSWVCCSFAVVAGLAFIFYVGAHILLMVRKYNNELL